MREIKFRAYDPVNKVMEYDVNVNLGKPVKQGYQWFNTENTVRHSTLMQYTGLRDKNGKDIYEGDIWLVQGGDIPRVIVWHRYGWWFQYPNGGVTRPMEWTEDGEVIGNIYEHPHLLGDST